MADGILSPSVWHVALGWHAIEIAQTSVILEFYFWFRFRPHHRSWHVILHQSVKFYPNRTTLGRKKWRHVDFQDGRSPPSWILEGPIMGSLKSPCTTSYRSSIETMALNCLFFLENHGFAFWRQTDSETDKQRDKQTDGQARAWSRSRCRERWLNNAHQI